MDMVRVDKKRCITGMIQKDMIGAIYYFYSGKPYILNFNVYFNERVGLFGDRVYLRTKPESLFQTQLTHNHYNILEKRFGKNYDEVLLRYIRIAVSGTDLKNRTVSHDEKFDIVEYDVNRPSNYKLDGLIVAFIASNAYCITLQEKGEFATEEFEVFDSIGNYELNLI